MERTTSRLSVQSNLLLRVLLSAGGDWLTRSSIARRLRKRRLSAYDIAMLEILQEKGLVEIQHREKSHAHRLRIRLQRHRARCRRRQY